MTSNISPISSPNQTRAPTPVNVETTKSSVTTTALKSILKNSTRPPIDPSLKRNLTFRDEAYKSGSAQTSSLAEIRSITPISDSLATHLDGILKYFQAGLKEKDILLIKKIQQAQRSETPISEKDLENLLNLIEYLETRISKHLKNPEKIARIEEQTNCLFFAKTAVCKLLEPNLTIGSTEARLRRAHSLKAAPYFPLERRRPQENCPLWFPAIAIAFLAFLYIGLNAPNFK